MMNVALGELCPWREYNEVLGKLKRSFPEFVQLLFVLVCLRSLFMRTAKSSPGRPMSTKKRSSPNDGANPNTGAVTLAGVSVVLAGAAVMISKKKNQRFLPRQKSGELL